MDNPIPTFTEETGEKLLETGKKVVKNVVKTTAQSVKGQLAGAPLPSDAGQVDQTDQAKKVQDKGSKKVDPVTGKPIPSKKVLSQLNQQVAQLAQMRMKRVREELEKQRLRTKENEQAQAKPGQAGPEVPAEPEKPKEDVISKVLKASKSTGEFGKNIAG